MMNRPEKTIALTLTLVEWSEWFRGLQDPDRQYETQGNFWAAIQYLQQQSEESSNPVRCALELKESSWLNIFACLVEQGSPPKQIMDISNELWYQFSYAKNLKEVDVIPNTLGAFITRFNTGNQLMTCVGCQETKTSDQWSDVGGRWKSGIGVGQCLCPTCYAAQG